MREAKKGFIKSFLDPAGIFCPSRILQHFITLIPTLEPALVTILSNQMRESCFVCSYKVFMFKVSVCRRYG